MNTEKLKEKKKHVEARLFVGLCCRYVIHMWSNWWNWIYEWNPIIKFKSYNPALYVQELMM